MNTFLKHHTRGVLILLALALGVAFWALFLRNQAPGEAVPTGDPDYGLVWFGADGRSQKAVPGQPNPYYNPRQPTIIYVPGWLPNQVATPPTFMLELTDEPRGISYHLDLAAAWVEAGWN
ncbi:MAG: hypothetical protein WBP47_17000, partial [Candidatus Promineifilaceae bacterium]